MMHEPPVLLLDDLLSELDAERRAHLLAAIGRPGATGQYGTPGLGVLR